MSVAISGGHGRVSVTADRYRLILDCDHGWGELMDAGGNAYFGFPLDARVTFSGHDASQIEGPLGYAIDGQRVELLSGASERWESQSLAFIFEVDCFAVSYSAVAVEPVRVSECFLFLRGEWGMNLNRMYAGFNPAPVGGRNGEEDLYSFTPAAGAYSYYSPCPLNIGLGFQNGWVGIGLIDLPNGDGISVEGNWSLKVDMPSGHLVTAAEEEYAAPRILVTFPKDEWDGIRAYRDVLVKARIAPSTPIEQRSLPDWWKTPIYCTYGDQIVEMQPYWYTDRHWDDPAYTSDWVGDAIENAERRLGYRDFTVVIDAFWMDRWDADPKPSRRFSDLKGLIGWCHQRGHKVLLWYFPLHTGLTDGKGSAARRFGVLAPGTPEDATEAPIDVTSPNFPAYAQYLAQTLFGNGEGEFDADGLKLDFLGALPHPGDTRYHDPVAGMGIRELRRWLIVFGEAARGVKPDVCTNWSAADPHFDGLFSSNRTHDTHFSPLEFERRARISSLAAPNTIINFDGCLMRAEWADACYLPAALYGTPSLYYSRKFHGAVDIPDEQMEVLGKLFQLSAKRPWGRPIFRSYGNWQLESGGRIVGETVDSKAMILFPDAAVGHVFSMSTERIPLPLHGRPVRSVTPEPPDLEISDNTITASWQRGVIYDLSLDG